MLGNVPDSFKPLDLSILRQQIRSILFKTDYAEGAVLGMPDGAIAENLLVYNAIRSYVSKHARSWYPFLHEVQEELEVSELWVVCGVDKVTA